MPCRCDGMENSSRKTVQNELDSVTQNLCFLCGQIEGEKLWGRLGNPRIRIWWENHVKNDTIRVRENIVVVQKVKISGCIHRNVKGRAYTVIRTHF